MTTAIRHEPVLLTLQDVAKELAITPVEVQRLIALKLLNATRLPSSGADGAYSYRVTVEALEAYVANGAVRLRPYEYTIGSPWFDNTLTNLADAFSTAIMDAAEEQVPSEATLRQSFLAAPKRESIDFEIKNTGKIAALLRQAVPSSFYGSRPQFGSSMMKAASPQSRFACWADLYAVETIRSAALQLMQANMGDGLTTPIAKFYRSPGDNEAFAGGAYEVASQRRIVFSKSLSFEGKPFGSVLPVSRRASFLFPVSTIISPAARTRLLQLAF